MNVVNEKPAQPLDDTHRETENRNISRWSPWLGSRRPHAPPGLVGEATRSAAPTPAPEKR